MVIENECKANDSKNLMGIKNKDSDIIFCYEYYAEPIFKYDE